MVEIIKLFFRGYSITISVCVFLYLLVPKHSFSKQNEDFWGVDIVALKACFMVKMWF